MVAHTCVLTILPNKLLGMNQYLWLGDDHNIAFLELCDYLKTLNILFAEHWIDVVTSESFLRCAYLQKSASVSVVQTGEPSCFILVSILY